MAPEGNPYLLVGLLGLLSWQQPAGPEDGFASAPKATEGPGSMKPIVIVGIVLIVVGLAALAYQGISYTTREKVVEIGPVQVTAEKEKSFRLSPIVGAAAVGAGLVLVVVGSRRS